MSRFTVRNPISIPIPNPSIRIGGTLGDAMDKVTKAVHVLAEKVVDYHGNIFESLNDEAKKLVNDFEECVEELGGISKDELATKLAKRVLSKLTPDVNQDQFNNIFKDEAITLYSEIYSTPTAGTCLFIVAGLIIAAAIIIIVYAPAITSFAENLIVGGSALVATACDKYS